MSFALQAPAALLTNHSSLAVKAVLSRPQLDGPRPTKTQAYEQDYSVQGFTVQLD